MTEPFTNSEAIAVFATKVRQGEIHVSSKKVTFTSFRVSVCRMNESTCMQGAHEMGAVYTLRDNGFSNFEDFQISLDALQRTLKVEGLDSEPYRFSFQVEHTPGVWSERVSDLPIVWVAVLIKALCQHHVHYPKEFLEGKPKLNSEQIDAESVFDTWVQIGLEEHFPTLKGSDELEALGDAWGSIQRRLNSEFDM